MDVTKGGPDKPTVPPWLGWKYLVESGLHPAPTIHSGSIDQRPPRSPLPGRALLGVMYGKKDSIFSGGAHIPGETKRPSDNQFNDMGTRMGGPYRINRGGDHPSSRGLQRLLRRGDNQEWKDGMMRTAVTMLADTG